MSPSPPLGIGSGNPYGPQGGTGSQNPYYDKNNSYGAGSFDWTMAPYGGGHFYNQPGAGNQAAYTAWTSGWGGGYDPFSQFVQSQRPRVNQAYEAALGVNRDLKWTDFLQQYGGENTFRQQFNNLAPQSRGQDQARFVPPANWQLRQ
jgi:hypothetical protein